MGEEDADLIAAVSQGSERAFNRLIDRHQQAVRNFLRGVAGAGVAVLDRMAQGQGRAAQLVPPAGARHGLA